MSRLNSCFRLGAAAISFAFAILMAAGFVWFTAQASGTAAASAETTSTGWFAAPHGSGSACTRAVPCSLAAAVTAAEPGGMISLAGGTYTSSGTSVLRISKSLSVYGGWDGGTSGPIHRDPLAYPTILDGETARRVVQISGPNNVLLNGFTVENGKGYRNGGGLSSKDANLTLQNMVFQDNAVPKTEYTYGGGAFVEGGELVVENSFFLRNTVASVSDSRGAGLAISNTVSARIENNYFYQNLGWTGSALYFYGDWSGYSPILLRGNRFVDHYAGYASAMSITYANATLEGNFVTQGMAGNDYGAIRFESSLVQMDRNVLVNNVGGRVSGILISNSPAFTLTNNVISGNQSIYDFDKNAAIEVMGSNGIFENNTIAQNSGAYGLKATDHSIVSMVNTILVSHTVGITVTSDSQVNLSYTLWGSGEWANGLNYGGPGTITLGAGNRTGDPMFTTPAAFDYHISRMSAARDAGTDTGLGVDMDGEHRPFGSAYDIGADEYRLRRIFLPVIKR